MVKCIIVFKGFYLGVIYMNFFYTLLVKVSRGIIFKFKGEGKCNLVMCLEEELGY